MKNLEPKTLWSFFESLTKIPRPSGLMKPIVKHLSDFGKSLNLETIVDELGNVLIRKPASAGYENHPGVILQAHLDMVPQKENSKEFDFEKDAIEAYVDGEWVTARGTTLGADNGIGVAAAMAVLADKTLAHPPIEAFFTVDEETGMYGAFALKEGVLRGKTLLNLDSETEGEVIIGCAGGVDMTAYFDYEAVPAETGHCALEISIGGLKGGHSGVEIHCQRGNANKLLFQVLKEAVRHHSARLASANGGNMRNAIPRDATALITCPADKKTEIIELVKHYDALYKTLYKGVDDGVALRCADAALPATLLPDIVQDFLINAIVACPSGVYRVEPSRPSLVETSNNLAIVETKESQVVVCCLARSSSEERKKEIEDIFDSIFTLADARVEFSGSYPGWQPNFSSHITKIVQQTYKDEFGQDADINAIHAGLECGILNRFYDFDMCSFGPTILHPHSPDEKVNIGTVERFYHLLLTILKKL